MKDYKKDDDPDAVETTFGIIFVLVILGGLAFLFAQVGISIEEASWKDRIREGHVQDMIDLVNAEDAARAASKKLEGVAVETSR